MSLYGSREVFICLFFRTISQKMHAAKIAKLDVQLFYDESWKPFILGQKVKGQGHESQNSPGVS